MQELTMTGYFHKTEASWAFRLLVLLVFSLVGGGIFLDYMAASVASPDFVNSREIRTDPKTGVTSQFDKADVKTEDRQALVELAKTKAQRLNESAKLLYDFAKIALGALIALITQLVANRPTERPTEKSPPSSAEGKSAA
jgi:hypothetical protein